MTRYQNHSGNSDVYAFELGRDYIIVQFESSSGPIYLYNYRSAGQENVENMKEHALAGRGLNGYITGYVKEMYAQSGNQSR